MLRIIVYDIAEPRRLSRIAKICENFGVRVQKSVFECWLDNERFEALWKQLNDTFDPREDSLIAYVINEQFARQRRTAGDGVTPSEKRSFYGF